MNEIVPNSNWRDSAFDLGRDVTPLPPADHVGFSLTVDDVLFALFRHKWLICVFTMLGLAAAAALYRFTPRSYHSEARLMVKSIPQSESLGPVAGDGQVKTLLPVETLINSEVDILTASDLAKNVASAVGPERILGAYGGGSDLDSAAGVVQGGIVAFPGYRSSTIRVGFQHPDPRLVQPVLSNLIAQYFPKHYAIHRALANEVEFQREKSEVKANVEGLEKKLRELRASTGVFSLEQSKKAASEEVEDTRKKLRDAETELLTLNGLLQRTGTNGQAVIQRVDTEEFQNKYREYADLTAQLQQKQSKLRINLGEGYSDESSMVLPLKTQIEEILKRLKQAEREYPELARLGVSTSGAQSPDPVLDRRRAEFLLFNVGSLSNRLTSALKEQARIDQVSGDMAELEAKLDTERKSLRYFDSELARAKWDATLSSSRDSNISIVQPPSPPVLQLGPLYKRMGMAAAAGVGLGIALALLIELFIDQRVKRPQDIRRLLSAPLYLSIPRGAQKGRLQLGGSPKGPSPLLSGDDSPTVVHQTSSAGVDAMQPYFDALRDRVLSRFDGIARKPKLVGVAGCVGGSVGGTRIAAGLAGALSEAGDLKILLVDMKSWNGKVHPILGRRKSCTLLEALEQQKQEDAQVAPNLYLASADGSDSKHVSTSSSKFTRVIPQLTASDYDYIIFDMPEVNQISITPRLAKHMDLMLLVVEAERAHRNAVKVAGSLLTESTSNIAVVLNNFKAALPKSLRQVV
ncbi:MAG: Wzz/FepE/Etk N-terminal domain-containing protein [Verrucomicrobiota bacterium]